MSADIRPHPYTSAYHAAAALILSGVVLMMAVPGLHLANELQRTHYAGFTPFDMRVTAWGGYIGVAVVLGLSVSAVVIAKKGWRAAARTGEPRVLCAAALALALFATVVWVACGLACHGQAWPIISRN